MKKNNKIFFVICLIAFISYILAIATVKLNPEFNLRWISFSYYLISLLALPLFMFKKTYFKKNIITNGSFILLILISFSLNFLFLKSYPFVSVGDEVRDGGLNAAQIVSGEIKNIYDYGRYQSHGLIIPTITSFFYLIFKGSVLTYRIPSAIVSFLSIITIYFLVKNFSNKKTAFLAALTLATSSLHLYYARTEIVIIFSSLITSIILLMLGLFIRNKSINNYALLGLILGFSSGFHASARTIVFITFIVIFISIIFFIIKNRKITSSFLGIILLIFYFLIGLGPRLLYTTPDIFFHLRTVSLAQSINNYKEIFFKYFDSLRMYVDKPLTIIPFHYQTQETLFPFIFTLFLLLGIAYVFLFKYHAFFKYLLLYLIIIPLTNSAITDCFQCNYRLIPLLIPSAIFIGLGIGKTIDLIAKIKFLPRHSVTLLSIIFTGYLLFQGYSFFSSNSASEGKTPQEYLAMHSIYFIKSLPDLREICLTISPANEEFFNYLHIQEQYEYFLPNVIIDKTFNPKVLDNEIYLSPYCTVNQKYFEYDFCDNNASNFSCPLGKNKKIKIYSTYSL